MTLPAELFDAVPLDSVESTSAPDPVLEQARVQLHALLADAPDPVDWLNQASVARRARSAGDTQWRQRLPAGLDLQAGHIESAEPQWFSVLEEALEAQAQVYADLLPLGSLPDSYPERLRDRYRAQHLQRLLDCFGATAPARQALAPWISLQSTRHKATEQARRALTGEGPWRESGPLQAAILAAMDAEASLQVLEGQITHQARDQLFSPDDQHPVQWLSVQVGEQPLPGVWAMVQASAWASGLLDAPLLVWVHGEGGGLICLEAQVQLRERLPFTLANARLPVSSLVPEDEAQLQFVPAPQGLTGLVQDLLDHWSGQLGDAPPANGPLAQLTPDQEAERRRELARTALSMPVDSCRQAAVAVLEQLWAADTLAQHLPQWLLARSEDERELFAAWLREYQQAAWALEDWLEEQLPPFVTFAGQLLCDRIQQDLRITLTPDTVLLHRPVSVGFHWLGEGTVIEPFPGGEFGFSGAPLHAAQASMTWVASDEWEDVTVAQLACEGFDGQDDAETRRLQMAQWRVAGISAKYLSDTLVSLDPLRQFETTLAVTFDPSQEADIQRLRRPYRLELQLLARVQHWRQALSQPAVDMLDTAAQVTSTAALAQARMRVHWLTINSNQALGSEIRGAGALVRTDSGLTVLVLPGAPEDINLIERDSLEQALAHLRLAIRTRTDVADYVAQRCTDDPDRLLSYFRQAASKGYDGFLNAPAAIDQTLIGLQLTDRRNRLMSLARQQGRNQLGIRISRDQQAHERHIGYLRAGLAIVPGVNVVVALQDIQHSVQAIGSAWRARDADSLGWAALSVAGAVADILLTAVPVAGGLWSLRRAVRLRLRQLSASRPLAGYEVQPRLRGATRLQGGDEGLWLHAGQQYIQQDGRLYAVYRRAGEHTLRLRATTMRRYEAPVRREGGRWVVHAEVGLRGGGGKLTESEGLLKYAGPRSRHQPFAGASPQTALARGRRILANYAFRSEEQRVEFVLSYLADGVAPAWSRTYLIGPGSSAGVPVTRPSQPWQQWRWALHGEDRVIARSGGEVSVHFGGQSDTSALGVRVEGNYYPILEGAASSRVRFIVQPGWQPERLVDLDDGIAQGFGPVRVRLGQHAAEAPEVLGGFAETFGARLARRYPLMNANARQVMGETLFRNARRRHGWSSITLEDLDHWLDDATSEPLRIIDERIVDNLQVAVNRDVLGTQTYEWRWMLARPEADALRSAVGQPTLQPFQAGIRRAIVDRGYRILQEGGHQGRCLFIFVRPGHREVYVLLQHLALGRVSLMGRNGMVLFGEVWLDELISRLTLPVAAALRTARQQRLLRPVLGGVHFEGPHTTELVWQRIHFQLRENPTVPQGRSWRHSSRELTMADIERVPGSGLYGAEGEALVQGVAIEGRWVPIFPVESNSAIVLTRTQQLPAPLRFDDLQRCVRQRYGEQPWLVVRNQQGWSVRRALFTLPLDYQVSRARPGLAQQSAQNVARTVFEGFQGSEHARLLHLEQVLNGWLGDTRALGDLADPLLLLAPQRPLQLEGQRGWRLTLALDAPAARPPVYYLRAVDAHSQQLLGTVSGRRMRQHAINVVDDMLRRYGLSHQQRIGNVVQYGQSSTGRVYLVLVAVSEEAVIDVAPDLGGSVLSQAWLAQWHTQIGAQARQALQQAVEQGRLVRLLVTLRVGAGPYSGQVAVTRLADF